MRYVLYLIFLFTSSLHAQEQLLPSFESSFLQEQWIDEELKGATTEFYIEEFNYDEEKAELYKSEMRKYYFYGPNGLNRIEFRKKGEPFRIYRYDQHGRIKEQILTGRFESVPRIVYKYLDKEGLSVETIYRLSGSVHSQITLKFNEELQLISKEEYQGIDQLIRYWLYEYNENGDLIREDYFDLNSQPDGVDLKKVELTSAKKFKHRYQQDSLIKEELSYQNGHLTAKTIHRNYPDSIVQEKLIYDSQEVPTKKQITITHDSATVYIKGFYQSGDTSRYPSRFKEIYVDGDLLEYESRTLKGTFVDRYATFYEFDHHGNWIKKTTYSNGGTVKIEQRRIRYK